MNDGVEVMKSCDLRSTGTLGNWRIILVSSVSDFPTFEIRPLPTNLSPTSCVPRLLPSPTLLPSASGCRYVCLCRERRCSGTIPTAPAISMSYLWESLHPTREPQATCGGSFSHWGWCLPPLRLLPDHLLAPRFTIPSHEEETPGPTRTSGCKRA